MPRGRIIKPVRFILTAQRDDSDREEVVYCTSKTAAIMARRRLRKEGWMWFHIFDTSLI